MRISVIIPAYNASQFLRRAVESLLRTGYSNLEVVVVDDGSTDSTFELASTLQAEHPENVVADRHADGANHGVSETRNRGIERSSGELICFLDADDYVLPHRFDIAVPILTDDRSVDGVYELCRVELEEGSASDDFWKQGADFGIHERANAEEVLEELLRGHTWAASAILFRRTLLDRTGLFRTNLKIAEDCNLWFRMACVGEIVPGNLTDPVSVYCRHQTNAYDYRPERKLDMIRAMIDAYLWAQKSTIPVSRRRTLLRGIQNYVLNGVIRAREEGDRKLASEICALPLRSRCFRVVASSAMFRQAVALWRESFAG